MSQKHIEKKMARLSFGDLASEIGFSISPEQQKAAEHMIRQSHEYRVLMVNLPEKSQTRKLMMFAKYDPLFAVLKRLHCVEVFDHDEECVGIFNLEVLKHDPELERDAVAAFDNLVSTLSKISASLPDAGPSDQPIDDYGFGLFLSMLGKQRETHDSRKLVDQVFTDSEKLHFLNANFEPFDNKYVMNDMHYFPAKGKTTDNDIGSSWTFSSRPT